MASTARRLFAIATLLFCFSEFPLAFAGETRAAPRIIDATLVPQSQLPTVGQIGSIGNEDFCTGTLIAPRFVLLACHCVNAQTAGSFSFGQKDGIFILGNKTYRTRHVYVHPSYVGDSSQQKEGAIDLAIFELDKEIKKVAPTPLYRTTPLVGTVLTLAGYGLLGTGSGGASGELPPKGQIAMGKTPIDIVTNTFLKWHFDNVPPPDQESNTAPGDSGGPEFITDNGTMFLASVTSGGVKNNASFGDLSYNTRVDVATDWIDSITGGTPVAGDHAPAITSLTASAVGFLPGTPVTFTTAASDADGDALEYHWIFGDGTEILNGTLTEDHTFVDDGEYLVQVVVSDQKGGSSGKTIGVGALSPELNPTPLTPATILKKSFAIDYSEKDKGAALDVTIQSPQLVFPDQNAFAAAFSDHTLTSLMIGDVFIDAIFGVKAKSATHAIKFDYRKGTIHFQLKKSQTLKYALNFFGAANATVKSSFVVPISLEILPQFQSTIRLGGDAAITYTAKLNASGKGK